MQDSIPRMGRTLDRSLYILRCLSSESLSSSGQSIRILSGPPEIQEQAADSTPSNPAEALKAPHAPSVCLASAGTVRMASVRTRPALHNTSSIEKSFPVE
jgi:hypothetical protein